MTFNSNAEKLLSPHKSLRKIARNIIVIFICFLVFIAFTPWQQTAFGTGKVIALSPNERKQVISAPIEGRLGKWYVHDGSYVNKGDAIIQLVDNDPKLLQRLLLEKEAIKSSINLSMQAAQTALINVKRQKKLYDEGISSRKKYEQARFMYLKYKNEIAKAKVSLAKIDVRIARQQSQLVKAPLSGTIVNRLSGENAVLVKQGDFLATLIPETSSRAVALWLDGNDIPLVHEGQAVRLQFEGWPAIQFSGWPSVAVGTFGGIVKFIDPTDNGRGQFRILVVPDKENNWPGAGYLRQGVKANAWVMLNQVPVWFELWRRFNGFPPAINEQPITPGEKKA